MVPALRQCLADQEATQVPTSDRMREGTLDRNGLNPLPTADPMQEGTLNRSGLDPDPTSDRIPVPTCLHARFLPGWQSILVLQDLRSLVCNIMIIFSFSSIPVFRTSQDIINIVCIFIIIPFNRDIQHQVG